MFIVLLSVLLIILSCPNKPRLKTRPSNSSVPMNIQSSCIGVVTEKGKSSQTSHSLNLQSSSVALQTANLDHPQLTSHLLNHFYYLVSRNSSVRLTLNLFKSLPLTKSPCRKGKPHFSTKEIAITTDTLKLENQGLLKSTFTYKTTQNMK